MSPHGRRHSRERLAAAVLLLAGAACIGAGTDVPPPLPARIVLRSGQAWDVELLGRFFADRVLLRRLEGSALIELPVADMARLDARFGFDLDPIAELYAAEKFEEAAARLAEGLTPFRPYVTDAAGNLEGAFRTLLLAHYWAGQYEQARALADHILGKTTASRLHRDAARVRALCRAATGAEDTPVPAAATDPSPSPDQPEASLHFYTLAILAMHQEEWDTAQEALARLITFRSRDFEWMPAALYQSAVLHARIDQVSVARQIVEEIALVYPATRWAEQARSLDLDALRPPPPPPPPEHPLQRR
jgi:tetratricopeptide (TPR) repeat protein